MLLRNLRPHSWNWTFKQRSYLKYPIKVDINKKWPSAGPITLNNNTNESEFFFFVNILTGVVRVL